MLYVNTYWILLSVVSYVSSTQHEKVTYDGAQVWRIVLKGADDVLVIKKLVDSQDISIWSLSPSRADFLLRAEFKMKVHRHLSAHNLSHTVLILDVQKKINMQSTIPPIWTENTLRVGHRLNWKKYPTLSIIEEFYNFLADDYSSICRVQTIGYTAENRTIKMINITNGSPNNKVMLITAGLHSREWSSVTSALYILNKIVTTFDQQPPHIQDKNWLIIPVMNPDGYAYSHTNDRLWRKNRRKFINCEGVDINRNFETNWEIAGLTEKNECRGTYSGPHPFSEAESAALRNIITSSKHKPDAVLDLHSYGSLILFPWSAKTQATPDLQIQRHAANEMFKAIFKTSKENYTFGAAYHIIYPASGTLLDWVYSQGVRYSFVIESRDKGEFGFLLPPEQIEATGKELFAAVRYLAKVVSRKMSRKKSDNQTWF